MIRTERSYDDKFNLAVSADDSHPIEINPLTIDTNNLFVMVSRVQRQAVEDPESFSWMLTRTVNPHVIPNRDVERDLEMDQFPEPIIANKLWCVPNIIGMEVFRATN
jgi:hypothetical protein